MNRTTACVLLYGDFPQYAWRCLDGVLAHFRDDAIRVWGNELSDTTRRIVEDMIERGQLDRSRVTFNSGNKFKYPVMREMLYGENPVDTEFMMWFDDDSFIEPTAPADWVRQVEREMRDCDQLGDFMYYSPCISPAQQEWVRAQPWYNNVATKAVVRFVVGGWWTMRTEVMRRFDWPTANIGHRGGDVMTGMLARQHNLRLKRWHRGVRVNANIDGKDHKAKRRGHDELPVGSEYRRPE